MSFGYVMGDILCYMHSRRNPEDSLGKGRSFGPRVGSGLWVHKV